MAEPNAIIKDAVVASHAQKLSEKDKTDAAKIVVECLEDSEVRSAIAVHRAACKVRDEIEKKYAGYVKTPMHLSPTGNEEVGFKLKGTDGEKLMPKADAENYIAARKVIYFGNSASLDALSRMPILKAMNSNPSMTVNAATAAGEALWQLASPRKEKEYTQTLKDLGIPDENNVKDPKEMRPGQTRNPYAGYEGALPPSDNNSTSQRQSR